MEAKLPGSGWTYHYDAINNVIHKIIRQSGMESQLEIEDYFIKKVREMAFSPKNTVPIMKKHLRGYIPDGRQLGIACGKFTAGIDHFTEVPVIHSGTIQYRRLGVPDDPLKYNDYIMKAIPA